jgi:hypothetical protein
VGSKRSGTDDVGSPGSCLGLPGWHGVGGCSGLCRRGKGWAFNWSGVRCPLEKPGGGWVPVWSVLQGKPRDVW